MTLDEALARYPGSVAFRFGDGPALNAEILALVRAGDKTVTCDALENFRARGEVLPRAGRVDIATDWDNQPQLALRTVGVTEMPFEEMTESLVVPQGEFRDLDDWRAGYGAYLSRAGINPEGAVMVVERFEIAEDFAQVAP